MSAVKFLDLAEERGMIEPKIAASLRKQIQSRPNATPEKIAKTLVEKGVLTATQARRLIEAVSEAAPSEEDDDLVMLEPAPPAAATIDMDPNDLAPVDIAPMDLAPVDMAPVDLAPADDVIDLSAYAEEPATPAPPPSRPRPTAAPPVDLEPVDLTAPDDLTPLGAAPSPKWKGAPKNVPSALEPLSSADAAAGMQPLGEMDDLLAPLPTSAALDPFAAPAAGDPLNNPNAAGAKPAVKKKVGPTNVWDSPLLLLGGGALLVMIVAFVVLYYSLTRGNASQIFAKAEEEYRAGSYAAAMASFDKFIEKFPEDEQLSRAKVYRGMSQLRQVGDNAEKDPRSALKVAQQVLPQIETEEQFSAARDELASILPNIANGFAEQAKAAEQMSRKVELAKLADESMALINNANYLPASQRKNLEARIASILDKLNVARRSIDQDKDLLTAVSQISDLVKEGKTAESYQVRTDLVRKFPGLENHDQLMAATLAISQREREAVRLAEATLAASTDDPRPQGQRIVLASRRTGSGKAISRPALVTIEGAVYSMDLASGQVLWRRYVGHESNIVPLSVNSRDPQADVLIVDARAQELYRLEAKTGKVRWRLPVGEPFFQPAIAGEKLLVACASGKILEVDPATGNSDRQLVLPQKTNVPTVFDAKHACAYQLGEHSTLFVLNDSLACEESFYLGHRAGAILVPPVLAVDHLLVAESPGDDFTLLHVLARDPEKKTLREVHRPFRLQGRVITPLGVSGRRVTVVTDLGEVNAFEIDPAIKNQPVQPVGKIEASEASPTLLYQATDGSRLWLAGRRCTMYEIQVSLQQLGRKWTLHQDDAFLGAPQIFGETLLHVRRRPQSPAVLVEACQAADGKAIWTTQLAIPLVGLTADMQRKQFVAMTNQAQVFEVPPEAYSAGYVDEPTFTPPTGTGSLMLREARALNDGRWMALSESGSSWALFVDPTAASGGAKLLDLGPSHRDLATQAVMFQNKLILPLASGRVELFDPATVKAAALPFQPPLAPGVKIRWNEPAVVGSERAVVIGDGKQTLYRLGLKDGPQPALVRQAEAKVEGELISPVASVGDLVYAVVREPSGDVLQLFQAGNLAKGTQLPLEGRWKMGPVHVGDKVLIELQERKFLCIDKDQVAWTMELSNGPLSAQPQLLDGQLLLVHASGTLAKVDAQSGQPVAAVDVGEPLGDVVTPFGTRLLVGGHDGVLHVAPQPQEQQ
jgi:hypothetical protein